MGQPFANTKPLLLPFVVLSIAHKHTRSANLNVCFHHANRIAILEHAFDTTIMQKNRNTPAHILQKYAPDADYSALADYAFGITTIDGVRIPPEQITQESDLLSSDNQQPSQRVDEANDINNHLPQGGDEQVEEEHFPGVRYLDDDNNRSYPAYERPPPSSVSPWLTPAFLSRLGEPDIPNVSRLRRLVPRRTKLYITNMDDLRREAARGERGFQVIVRDIDSKGWAAAFDDVFKWLKWSKYGFYTPEHFGDWCMYPFRASHAFPSWQEMTLAF